MKKNKKVALFDIDGTVISQDSFKKILRYWFLREPWRFFLTAAILPLVSLTRGEFFSRAVLKSAFLWGLTVFRNKTACDKIFNSGKSSAPCLLKPALFKEVTAELKKLRSSGISICYISASASEWLKGIISLFDNEDHILISTRLRPFLGGFIVSGKNCYGEEKIKRLREYFDEETVFTAGYTDSPSDIPFLKLCQKSYIINANKNKKKKFSRPNLSVTHLTWHRGKS